MLSSAKTIDRTIETVPLSLGGGWNGRAVLFDSLGNRFSLPDWEKCLAQPEFLFEDTEQILKSQNRNRVAVKKLQIGLCQLKAVIKRHSPAAGFREFFRAIRPGKAVRNLKTSSLLLNSQIDTVYPLAALQKRKNLLVKESIFITEFCENSWNLHFFTRDQLKKISSGKLKVKKQLAYQIAGLWTALHKNNLWHRDSKATNFIIHKDADGKYKVLLVDIDGIKPYRCFRTRCQLRSLWGLAASLMQFSSVNRTDYWRTFKIYSKLVGFVPEKQKKIFRELSELAQVKYQKTMAKKPKNILIIKPSSLGDIVLALPVLSALRKSFPQAGISWFVRPDFAPLIKGHPYLDDVILFDRRYLGKAWYNPSAFAALISLIRLLRRRKFDTVIDLQGLFRTASLGWLSGSKNRFGIENAREFAHIFYTNKTPQDRDNIHLVDYYLNIVRNTGANNLEPNFILPIENQALDSVNKLLNAHSVDKNNYAVIVSGSAHPDKCWPIERFAAIADKLSENFGLSIIATGTKAEKNMTAKLAKLAHYDVADFAGLTNICELTALMKNAKIVISNDTGPGHIAAALGVPLVLIFGRSNPARVAPYKRKNSVAAIEPDSRGFNADSTDPKHNINNITLEHVYNKVFKQLQQKSPPNYA
jgi:heptosyltransferase-1